MRKKQIFIKDKKQILIQSCGYQVIRNNSCMKTYKTAINKCCNPDCETPYEFLETHHIVPIKQGGEDKCINYISLCFTCHHNKNRQGLKKLHGEWYKWTETLIKWKFYNEILIIGYTSDDYTHEKYLKLLRYTIMHKNEYEARRDEINN